MNEKAFKKTVKYGNYYFNFFLTAAFVACLTTFAPIWFALLVEGKRYLPTQAE